MEEHPQWQEIKSILLHGLKITESGASTYRNAELQVSGGTQGGIMGRTERRYINAEDSRSQTQATENQRYWSYPQAGYQGSQDDNRSESTSWPLGQREIGKDQIQIRDSGPPNQQISEAYFYGDSRYTESVQTYTNSSRGLGGTVLPTERQILSRSIPRFWPINCTSYILNDYYSSTGSGPGSTSFNYHCVPRRILPITPQQDNPGIQTETIHPITGEFGFQSAYGQDCTPQSNYQIPWAYYRYNENGTAGPGREDERSQTIIERGTAEPSPNIGTNREIAGQAELLLQSSTWRTHIHAEDVQLPECKEIPGQVECHSIRAGAFERCNMVAQHDVCNNTALIPRELNNVITTDACDYGCGGWIDKKGFQYLTDRVETSWHINMKELLAVLIALRLWANDYQNQAITFHSRQSSNGEMVKEGLCEIETLPRTSGNDYGNTNGDLLHLHPIKHTVESSVDTRGTKPNSGCFEQSRMELNTNNNKGAESDIQARYIQALELEARFIISKELSLKDNSLNIMRGYIRWGTRM